jgi:hypothetical protein
MALNSLDSTTASAQRRTPDRHVAPDGCHVTLTTSRGCHEHQEDDVAGKNKGGREARKPKQEHNKKASGQTPSAVSKALAPADAAGGSSSR